MNRTLTYKTSQGQKIIFMLDENHVVFDASTYYSNYKGKTKAEIDTIARNNSWNLESIKDFIF